jgi:hypothetical protein
MSRDEVLLVIVTIGLWSSRDRFLGEVSRVNVLGTLRKQDVVGFRGCAKLRC